MAKEIKPKEITVEIQHPDQSKTDSKPGFKLSVILPDLELPHHKYDEDFLQQEIERFAKELGSKPIPLK